jgi:hypothetical protein
MKTALGHVCKAGATRLLSRYGLASPLAVLLRLTLQLSTARADTIFVRNFDTDEIGAGFIGEYTTDGATVNPAPISGLIEPVGIAVSGSDLFVTNVFGNTIDEYTTDGATVNPALISGLSAPFGIAIVPTVAPEPSSFLLLVSGGLAMMMIRIIRSARRMALARATKREAD